MQVSSVLARDDTFFGVCEALGEDFRFNPLFLRLGFAGLLFFNPLAAVGAYAAAGVVVGLSRWFVPNPRIEIPDAEDEAGGSERVETGDEQQQELELAIAA